MADNSIVIDNFRVIDIHNKTQSAVINVYYDLPEYKGKYMAKLCDRNKPTKYVVVKETLTEVRNAIPYGLVKMDPLLDDTQKLIERYI